jgi:hypothetical protein
MAVADLTRTLGLAPPLLLHLTSPHRIWARDPYAPPKPRRRKHGRAAWGGRGRWPEAARRTRGRRRRPTAPRSPPASRRADRCKAAAAAPRLHLLRPWPWPPPRRRQMCLTLRADRQVSPPSSTPPPRSPPPHPLRDPARGRPGGRRRAPPPSPRGAGEGGGCRPPPSSPPVAWLQRPHSLAGEEGAMDVSPWGSENGRRGTMRGRGGSRGVKKKWDPQQLVGVGYEIQGTTGARKLKLDSKLSLTKQEYSL